MENKYTDILHQSQGTGLDFLATITYSELIMRAFYTILLAFVLISCNSSTPPNGALSEAQFVTAYCDLLEASLRSRNTQADSATAFLNATAALEKSGATREAFELTREWYAQDVSRWKGFMERVTVELEQRELKPLLPQQQPASLPASEAPAAPDQSPPSQPPGSVRSPD